MSEETLFALALEKPAGADRLAFLDEACADDAPLRDRLALLLAADDRASGILERGPDPAAALALCRQETPAPGQSPDTAPYREGSRSRTTDPPGYELIEKVGEGGMGVVYRARDTRLNRIVALKMVQSEAALSPVSIRFLAEAEAVAAVKHPNVVQVYEYGEAGGGPFLALEYLSGGTLADRLKACGRIPPQDAAQLLAKVADGVAAAHARGIVHRDLKPANVLFDESCEPKVTDFGLARRTAASGVTQTGAVMGTPPYMSPEQAGGKTRFIGPQSDVWSMGVMLYECLAGERPFVAESLEEMLAKVRSAEFVPLRTRVKRVPRDLDTIVSRCLGKDPADRYPGARELADDLARFVRGEPIAARPVGRAERLARWVRRNPTRAAAWGMSGLALALVVVVLVIAAMWRDSERARDAAVAARADEEAAKKKVEDLLGVEQGLRGELQGANEKLGVALQGENAAKRQVAYLHYAHAVDLAYREYEANNIARARELLEGCPEELRRWEWHYVHRLCHADLLTFRGHTAELNSVAFSSDGKRVLTASADQTARVWDARTGAELLTIKCQGGSVLSASFSTNGKRVLAWASDGTVRVWDSQTGKEIVRLKHDLDWPGRSAVFSPDSTRVVTASRDGTARVWDAENGKELALLKGHTKLVWWVAFSPDGKRVLTASEDKTARVWDAGSGVEVALLEGHTESVHWATFDADGKRVLTWSYDKTVRVWDAKTGNERTLLKSPAGVHSAAFSSDGKRVLMVSWEGPARLWDVETGKELAVLKGPAGVGLAAVSFSADGRRVVTADVGDKTAQVWDAATGLEVRTIKGHTNTISSVALSPDGRRVVTASWDGTARLWDAEAGTEPTALLAHDGNVALVQESEDGRRYARGADVRSLSWSGDGRRVITGSEDGTARVWDVRTGAQLLTLKGHSGPVQATTFIQDGRRVLTWSSDETIREWDAEGGKELTILKGPAGEAFSATFSPDGRRLLLGLRDGTVRVWDAEGGKDLASIRHSRGIGSAAFWPDGKWVITGAHYDVIARVWDAQTGVELKKFERIDLGVASLSVSADGRRVVTGGHDGIARVWNAQTGAMMSTLQGSSPDWSVAFSPDGRRVVTGVGSTFQVWDAETGKLMLTLPVRYPSFGVRFSDDGTRILITGYEHVNISRLAVYDARPVNREFVKSFQNDLPLGVAPPPREVKR